jgi:hypothetical protein
LVIVILAAVWAGGWFALAAWADGQVSGLLARAKERGLEVECGSRDIVGFPFALKLSCDETAVAETRSGTAAQLAGMTGGASVFAPGTAQVALASPAHIESPLLTGPAELRWEEAEVDVAMGLGGPKAIAFEADAISAELPLPHTPASFTARSVEGTLAPADGGTDASLSFTELALSAAGATFPAFDGRLAAWVSAPPRALAAGRGGPQAPLSARLADLQLTSGAARLSARGDLAVDAEGVLDGVVTLTIAGVEALPDVIAALPPEHQKLGNAAAGALLAFGTPTTLDGASASELRLDIQAGRARVGPVEIDLPRLPL